jgi:glutathione S-transferase
MIMLYDSPLSGNCHKVRMALGMLGLLCTLAPGDAAARATLAFGAINPLRQVPVLNDEGFVLRDSQAILAYLAAKHRFGDWDGDTPAERGEIGQWLSIAANEIANGPATLRLAKLFGVLINEANATAVTTRIMPVIEAHLSTRDWLVGGRTTVADLALSPYLALAPDGGIDLTAYPHIGAWVARIARLPGFVAMPGWSY